MFKHTFHERIKMGGQEAGFKVHTYVLLSFDPS